MDNTSNVSPNDGISTPSRNNNTIPRRKGVTISLAGTNIPIYFLDNSFLILQVTTQTTAAGALIAIRDQVSNIDYISIHRYRRNKPLCSFLTLFFSIECLGYGINDF